MCSAAELGIAQESDSIIVISENVKEAVALALHYAQQTQALYLGLYHKLCFAKFFVYKNCVDLVFHQFLLIILFYKLFSLS